MTPSQKGLPGDMTGRNNTCWSYSGANGAEHWGELHADWKLCGEGRWQSPIALPQEAELADMHLSFHYAEVRAQLSNVTHSVRIELGPGAGFRLDGHDYALRQFHFHTPAEHLWSTDADPAELHLVHRNQLGGIAVIGVALRTTLPSCQSLPQALWEHLMGEESEQAFALDLRQMLPEGGGYFNYSGSMTTPPCTEGVQWLLAREPLAIREEHVAWLNQQTGPNARPVQPIGKRQVYQIECSAT